MTTLYLGSAAKCLKLSAPSLGYSISEFRKELCGSRIKVAGILKGNSMRSSTTWLKSREFIGSSPTIFPAQTVSKFHVSHLPILEAFQITVLRNYRQPHEPTLTSGLRTKHLQPATGTWLNHVSGRPIFAQLLCCRQHLKHADECLSTCCGIKLQVCNSENNYFCYKSVGCCYIKLLHVSTSKVHHQVQICK
jgi:hypothetical protein